LTSKHPLDNSQITGNREVIAGQKPACGKLRRNKYSATGRTKKGRNPGFRPCESPNGCGGQIWTDDLRVMRSDSAFAESRTVPSSRVTGCSPSSLYAFLVVPRLGSVLPYPHSGL